MEGYGTERLVVAVVLATRARLRDKSVSKDRELA